MNKAIHTNIAFGLVSSVVLTIAGVCLTPQILVWMNVESDVLPYSILYFRYYFFGATGVIMYNTFNGILQVLGNSRRPLLYLIISSSNRKEYFILRKLINTKKVLVYL